MDTSAIVPQPDTMEMNVKLVNSLKLSFIIPNLSNVYAFQM